MFTFAVEEVLDIKTEDHQLTYPVRALSFIHQQTHHLPKITLTELGCQDHFYNAFFMLKNMLPQQASCLLFV